MKLCKYFGLGAITFLTGFLTMLIFGAFLGQTGSGSVNASVFNTGIMALAVSIIFLCAVMIICTMMLINAIRGKKT